MKIPITFFIELGKDSKICMKMQNSKSNPKQKETMLEISQCIPQSHRDKDGMILTHTYTHTKAGSKQTRIEA